MQIPYSFVALPKITDFFMDPNFLNWGSSLWETIEESKVFKIHNIKIGFGVLTLIFHCL